MTEHEKFNELMTLLGLSKKELAKRLSMGYKSVLNQTEPGKTSPKKLARWAKAMILTHDILEDKKVALPSDDMEKTTDVVLGFDQEGKLVYLQGFDINKQRGDLLKAGEFVSKFPSNYIANISRLRLILNSENPSMAI